MISLGEGLFTNPIDEIFMKISRDKLNLNQNRNKLF